jgi:hypothetical protein
MADVTVKGWVLRDTANGMAVVFLWADRRLAHETILLPKSQIAVVKGEFEDEVTMPEWLADDRGLN